MLPLHHLAGGANPIGFFDMRNRIICLFIGVESLFRSGADGSEVSGREGWRGRVEEVNSWSGLDFGVLVVNLLLF
jgi:hypothetical protein